MRKSIYTNCKIYIGLAMFFLNTSLTQARAGILPPETADELLIPHAPDNPGEPAEQYFGGSYLPAVTKAMIGLAGSLAVIFIIVGGIQILTAYGNEEKIKKGKSTVQNAIIGLLIAILAYAIVTIISSINLG